MAGILGNDLGRNDAVSPFGSIGNGGPDKSHGTVTHKGLFMRCVGDLVRQLDVSAQEEQFVLQWQITVESGLKFFHPVHRQVGHKGMAGASRWHRATGNLTVLNELEHSLACPKQEGELFQGQSFLCEFPAAFPLSDRLDQRHLSHRQVLGRNQVNQCGIFRIRLLRRRRRHLFSLICLHLAPLFPRI